MVVPSLSHCDQLEGFPRGPQPPHSHSHPWSLPARPTVLGTDPVPSQSAVRSTPRRGQQLPFGQCHRPSSLASGALLFPFPRLCVQEGCWPAGLRVPSQGYFRLTAAPSFLLMASGSALRELRGIPLAPVTVASSNLCIPGCSGHPGVSSPSPYLLLHCDILLPLPKLSLRDMR